VAFTYFFRDRQTLELMAEHVVPVLKGQRYINVWDAGCAHGPEAYSIAIMLRENMTRFLFRNVRIYATDIDPTAQFGPIVTEGIYPEAELRRMPDSIRARYFTPGPQPGTYRVVDELRQRVSFIRHDLLSLEPVRVGFSCVVCKNVLLHFTPEQRCGVIRMFHEALREGGFLVMEQTQELPAPVGSLFEPITGQGQLYRKLEPATRVGAEEHRNSRGQVCCKG